MRKILGTTNPADVCTKYQYITEIREKLQAVNIGVEEKAKELGRETRGCEVGPIEANTIRKGVGAGSSWARLQRGGPRVTWADAVDSEEDGGDEVDEGEGVGVREVRIVGTDDALTGVVRGGVLRLTHAGCEYRSYEEQCAESLRPWRFGSSAERSLGVGKQIARSLSPSQPASPYL